MYEECVPCSVTLLPLWFSLRDECCQQPALRHQDFETCQKEGAFVLSQCHVNHSNFFLAWHLSDFSHKANSNCRKSREKSRFCRICAGGPTSFDFSTSCATVNPKHHPSSSSTSTTLISKFFTPRLQITISGRFLWCEVFTTKATD